MINNKLVALAITGVLYSVGINVALASATSAHPTPSENIQHDAVDACKDSKEGANCMYIQNDTKFTGTCVKENDKHDGKIYCKPF